MNSKQRMLEQIRKSLEDHRATELQDNAFSYVSFLLHALDEAEADKQRLINGLWNLPLPSGSLDIQEVLDSVGENPAMCEDHNPRQHRDGKPPWCRKCGLTKDFKKPTSVFDRRKD